MQGKIVKGIAGFYYVHVVGSGVYECKAKGVFRKENIKPLVGDNVEMAVIDGEEKDGLYDLSKLAERDKYAMFLYSNNGVTEIENAAAPEGSILVVKDSYANSFVPFLAQSYRKVIVVDLRSLGEKISELISRERPDRVLFLYSFPNFVSDANLPKLKY